MSKLKEKQEAIELRKKGLSYNEIRRNLKVSKSSLSLWLRSVGMAQHMARRLTEKQRDSQKKAVAMWRQIRVDRTKKIKQSAATEVGALSKREKWLIGAALYWAEGSKERGGKSAGISFSNSDPRMVIFFRQWIVDFLKVSKNDLKFELYIHEGSNQIKYATQFWTSLLNITQGQLKLRLKRHNPLTRRKNTGTEYIGLIRIKVPRSTDMNRKIDGWISGIVK